MQKCRKCNQEKEFNLFSIDKRNVSGYNYTCKSCENIRKKESALRNPRKYSYRPRVTISEDRYNELKESQGGKCAICGIDHNNGNKFCVDHCHKEGHVRGLLCHKCNRILGQWNDNVDTFSKAIKYLQNTG